MGKFLIPDALPPQAHLFVKLGMAYGSEGNAFGQNTDNFLINNTEEIQFKNITIIALFEILSYGQGFGIAPRQGCEGLFTFSVVFPAFQKDQGIAGEFRVRAQRQGVGRLEQVHGKILHGRRFRVIPVYIPHLSPEKGSQSATFHEFYCIAFVFSQFPEQAFQNVIHAGFRAGTDSQHFHADFFGGIVGLEEFFQRFSALDGTEKFKMFLHHIGELQAKLKLGKPETDLIRTEFAVCQQHVQQPILQIFRLRAFMV